ncbi:periplasmic murein peptide-binding protein precursor [Clostridium saccharobutylicum]|uniref:ABC transporter substrate-binding protein n=1 Tax=Clostridium saccharobutylicum TaxID=169679 RepID=UPI000983B656|nr:ABC transporter substrate-binding protein [Clostridium saccharobutylicum]AQS08338.1 periplasmic murein peptide-binding protein precursor [Clostridium saccharobutylicum]MBC2435776.1 peptide ABC transporter substrate-binding protein [Clostridium saccharobutylicum]NSB88299.1 peptide/nickel transport system substrate-binding protein [Clostridium saccharobutylicum]NYC29335.1 peptide/nickel transport system substrate-binding protein [Clostridium saccharobutylicum]OOM10865.1 periplasmic murein pep
MKRYIFLIVMLLLAVIFCFSFIGKDTSKASDINSEQSLIYGVDDISTDLRSVTNLSKRQEDIICALSKGLVSKNAQNKIVPSLASDIKEDSEGIQYEFKIRDDVFWSDGSKITPNDIVEFFKELLKEEDEENIKALLDVYGAKDFKAGKTTFEKGVAISATNDAVIIRLNTKNNNFLSELTKPQYRVRKYLIMWGNMKNNYKKLIYSGDFSIDSINDDSMVLKKNQNSSDDIISNINILKDENVELSMACYEVNQRDIVIDPPETELSKLDEEGKLITEPKIDATYLYISNKENLPVQARREIYNDVCKAVASYKNTNNKTFELAEGSYFREDKENLTKVQARKVSSNKIGTWKKPDILTILGEDNDKNRSMCRIIQDWFKNNTNITIKYSLVKESEFKDDELRNRYDMVLINNDADILNKATFYSSFQSYLTGDQVKLLKKAGDDKKNDSYGELEESLFNDYDILPLVFYNENIAISSKVSQLNLDGNGNIDFTTIK